ncbi:MAG TPA: FtsX-like permease family protein [Pirellulales bacterium]|nr:FtsX-like permease family protein [Pirellulales bacterium]
MMTLRDAWRELLRRPGRTLLSLLSVVIAVAALVAVSAATATTRQAYQQVFRALAGDAAVEIVAAGGGPFDQSKAEAVEKLPGVRTVLPVVNRITFLRTQGKRAKVLVEGIVPTEAESIGGFNLSAGDWPSEANDIMVDAQLADSLSLKVGDEAKLMLSGHGLRGMLRTVRIAGLVKPNDASRLLQGGMVLAPVKRLQRWVGLKDEVDSLHLYLDDGATAQTVIDEATKVLPPELSAKVPAAQLGLAEESTKLTQVSLNLTSTLSFTTAVFIVLNIFLMSVGERRRQISILRAIGATRQQILVMVTSEAALLGVVGAALGIPAGIHGGRLLSGTMAQMLQIELPEQPILRWPLLAGAILGPVLCLIGAWYPAQKASEVSPLEGLRPHVAARSRGTYRRSATAGAFVFAISSVLAAVCIFGLAPMWLAIGTVISSLVSVVLLLPALLGPAVRLVTRLFSRFSGFPLEIAERLVVRETGRSSLTVGVLFMAVAAGLGTSNAVLSITQDVHDWHDQTLTADFLLRVMVPDTTVRNSVSMPEELDAELKALPGIARVDTARAMTAEAAGYDCLMLARNFKLYDKLPLMAVGGDGQRVLKNLQEGEVAVGSVLAQRAKLQAGDTLQLQFGGETQTLRVAGVVNDYTAGGRMVYIDRATAEAKFGVTGVDAYLIDTVHPTPPELTEKLTALAERDGLLLNSFAQIRDRVDHMVSGVVGGLWVLLALGLLVGALGVVNTLTMNVLEQTQELGMLRAIGMTRLLLMRTVLAQALLIGLLGLAMGAASGFLLAATINLSLASLFGHYVHFALRPDLVALLLSGALAIVLLAALAPAWRAARLKPIVAMRSE